VLSEEAELNTNPQQTSRGTEKERRTAVCKQTLCPRWNETMSFLIDSKRHTKLACKVLDYDQFTGTLLVRLHVHTDFICIGNDFLGQACIDISGLPLKQTTMNKKLLSSTPSTQSISSEIITLSLTNEHGAHDRDRGTLQLKVAKSPLL
jgi:Ca2+-dependent lipid-binding protein